MPVAGRMRSKHLTAVISQELFEPERILGSISDKFNAQSI